MENKRIDRGDGRDAKGRYMKCGNNKGRPPNVPDLEMSDVYNFSHVATEFTIDGKKQLMTRHEIMLFKMFESASNGSVTAQKYVLEKFEAAESTNAYLRMWLEKWADRMDEDPKSVPVEAVRLMERILNSQERPRSKIRTRSGGKRKRR